MATKRRAPAKIAQPAVKQVAKKTLKANVNEADTAVSGIDTFKSDTNGVTEDVIEISSDAASSEYEFSDEEKEGNDRQESKNASGKKSQTQNPLIATKDAHLITDGKSDGDVDMNAAKPVDGDSEDQELASPTFGDLVRAHETIDVPAALSAQQPSALASSGRALAPPSLASLGTVLSQALRTDDADLLESCLHTTDLPTIRNTIQRLDSSLAGNLLTKLASRMHRRPGRAGSLMTWVQWTLVAHGGALATQPGLAKKLSELNRVLEERSRGLTSLLALKGKLDMLEAQMQLRNSMRHNIDSDDEAGDDEEGVVYVEGEEYDADAIDDDMDVDEDNLPAVNGNADEEGSDDEEDYSEEEDDDEDPIGAEEPLDENEVDHSDVESLGEDEDSEAEAAPPTKRGRR
ncbi:Dip2/Utp12 family-domain-containing protein [Xylariales sp. PMI_506]|nr:Dip2/Utp12 family-domain-containing protein [Xylariales sp. PMI_506]